MLQSWDLEADTSIIFLKMKIEYPIFEGMAMGIIPENFWRTVALITEIYEELINF